VLGALGEVWVGSMGKPRCSLSSPGCAGNGRGFLLILPRAAFAARTCPGLPSAAPPELRIGARLCEPELGCLSKVLKNFQFLGLSGAAADPAARDTAVVRGLRKQIADGCGLTYCQRRCASSSIG
jgi:hypothetical protein